MSEFEPKDPANGDAGGPRAEEGSTQEAINMASETSAPVQSLPDSTSTPTTPPPKSGIGKLVVGIVFGGLAVTLLFVFVAVLSFASRDGGLGVGHFGRNKVAVVPINGEIYSSSPVVEQLSSFADNRSIRAIVVRINSPGGAVAPSQEIYEEILRIRSETGKPVVASMDIVAASGGYYIAAACDHIVANPGSITGSIGVIAQWFNLEDLVEWAKLRPETITSGELKDAGSPFRDMTREEREYYQRIVSQLHEQFIGAVIEGRDGRMTADEVRELADGRVFTGSEALELKLVDQNGGLNQAVRKAGEMAGIKGEPSAVYPRVAKPGLLDVLAESREATGLVQKILAGKGSPFLYRW
jgi:protease-4